MSCFWPTSFEYHNTSDRSKIAACKPKITGSKGVITLHVNTFCVDSKALLEYPQTPNKHLSNSWLKMIRQLRLTLWTSTKHRGKFLQSSQGTQIWLPITSKFFGSWRTCPQVIPTYIATFGRFTFGVYKCLQRLPWGQALGQNQRFTPQVK